MYILRGAGNFMISSLTLYANISEAYPNVCAIRTKQTRSRGLDSPLHPYSRRRYVMSPQLFGLNSAFPAIPRIIAPCMVPHKVAIGLPTTPAVLEM